MKTALVVVLVVVAILAAIAAVEYLTVPIHSLPSFLPGRSAKGFDGHYHKRGAVAAVVAVLALLAAGFVAFNSRRGGAAAPATPSSGSDLLSGPPD